MIGSEGRNDGKPAPVVVDRKPCSGSDKEEGGRRGQLRTGRACGVRGGTHTLAAGTRQAHGACSAWAVEVLGRGRASLGGSDAQSIAHQMARRQSVSDRLN